MARFEGGVIGEFGHRERGMGSELLTYHSICFDVLFLDTYYIYASIESWYSYNFQGKMGNMVAWYLATSPPESACLLTRVFVYRLM